MIYDICKEKEFRWLVGWDFGRGGRDQWERGVLPIQ